jgi:cob(I)alamin adenosyltransferase
LHLARTVARRAERAMTRARCRRAGHPETIKYVNRLSDHLFVLASQAQRQRRIGCPVGPGGNR